MSDIVTAFDKTVATGIARFPRSLEPIMVTATLIGEPVVVICVAIVIAVVAWVKHSPKWALASGFGIAAFGVNTAIKYLVHRNRPVTMYVEHMKIKSFSFPSGHAFGSMFFYGLLAYLAYMKLPQPWNIIVPILIAVLILLIGVSRVYLGAHFPTDVLIGWLFGAACLFLAIKLFKL